MIIGLTLAAAALIARTLTVNRYIRARLSISAVLFAAYASTVALTVYSRLPPGVELQVHATSPLLVAFGLANAIVVLLINPWRVDAIPERFPNIVQDTIVIGLFALAALLFLPDKVVATTAVGAVVIGFALQDTLGNLFAGLAIQIEKPFRVGHWVTIGGKDGLVSEITWRATKIRTKAGNFVVVPNSVLSRDTITNYSEPTRETRLEVQVNAAYDVPPNEVKRAVETALVDEPLIVANRSDVILADFADSWVTYRVRVWTTDFAADDRIRDRVRSHIYYAFRRQGIAFPHPLQTQLHVAPQRATRQDQAALDSVEIFSSLTPGQHEQLAAMARHSLYGAGEVIAREGDEGASMFVLLRGEASVTVAGSSREVARFGDGAFFGEMSLLTGDRRSATVTAVTDCELLEIGHEAFRMVVLSDAASVERVATAVNERRADLERHRAARAVAAAGPETTETFVERIKRFFNL
jgi:small-conductance mechanosensitive channel/CRP-like cAMP-binding protein